MVRLRVRYSARRDSVLGPASTGDGFAAESSFIQIVRKAYRNFASRLIGIGLEDDLREGNVLVEARLIGEQLRANNRGMQKIRCGIQNPGKGSDNFVPPILHAFEHFT